MNLKNSNCDETQKLKCLQNSNGEMVNRDACIGGCTSAGRRVLMAIKQAWKRPKLFDRQISAKKEEPMIAKITKKKTPGINKMWYEHARKFEKDTM